jgi:hypothetical protein
MKPFCFIFNLYFLALSLMPCSDVHEMNAPASAEFASLVANEHSDCPHETGDDHCSPFCTCSCCGQVIAQSKAFKWQFKPIIPEMKGKSAFHYAFDWQNGHLNSIFRPPQV